MGDVTCVLAGLDEFEVTGAVETAVGELEVSVRVARPDAACPGCGTFSSRVKEYRTQRVRDGLSYERPTILVWAKRRFRCDTPGCVGTFTESSGQVPMGRRVTARLCAAMAQAAWDRSTAAVARTFRVTWATAWRAIAAAARAKIAALPQRPPRRLGIDETTFGRHGSFMCGLVDLDTSRLWDLIEGRSKKVLTDNYRLRVLHRCA
jgi:transposase